MHCSMAGEKTTPATDPRLTWTQNAIPSVFPNSTSVSSPDGVGLLKALDGYSQWIKDILVPGYCRGFGYWGGLQDLSCFDTYNASSPFYTDVSLNNSIDRQWNWLLCNEP